MGTIDTEQQQVVEEEEEACNRPLKAIQYDFFANKCWAEISEKAVYII